MDKELEDFIERLPERKKGKLAKWEYAIFKLREVGATFTEISEFLKIKGVIAHTSEIHRFVHAKKRRLGKTKPVISPIQGKIEIENKGSLEIPGTVMGVLLIPVQYTTVATPSTHAGSRWVASGIPQ